MFEFTICAYNDEKIIEKIYGLIHNQIKLEHGLIIKEQVKRNYNLCIAVSYSKKELIVGMIYDAICDAIIFCYKPKFFKERIRITVDKNNYDKLLWAIITFDLSSDKNIIKNNLVFTDRINLTSLYMFRLFELKKRWSDICDIINNNMSEIISSNTMDQLMEDFIVASENKVENLHIFANKREIRVKIDNNCSDLVFLCDSEYSENLIIEIISLNPKRIYLHGDIGKISNVEKVLAKMFNLVYEK